MNFNPSARPMSRAEQAAMIVAIVTVMGGCGDHVKKCLGERGEGKKESIEKMVKECDSEVDKYVGTTNAEISEDPGITAQRFREASEACKLASIRAAQLYGDVRAEAEIAKGSKKAACLKAKTFAKARNAEANADAARLHRKQF